MLEYFNRKDIIQGDFALMLSRGKRSVNCICDTLKEIINDSDNNKANIQRIFIMKYTMLCYVLYCDSTSMYRQGNMI